MTQDQLPIVKITRPRTEGILYRHRVFHRLDEERKRPLIWISGPAGSGKTALVSSYIDSRNLPCLWYKVDEGDRDLATFFYYLGMAGQNAFPQDRKPLPFLTPEYLPGIKVFSKRFFENLYGRLRPPFALVFDNLDCIPDESLLHEILSEGLSITPEGVNVVLISRADPPPAFARLRASNKISFLGWDRIKFNLEESNEILRLHVASEMRDEVVTELAMKAEGWAAGLILMVEMAKIYPVAPQYLDRHTPEWVFDYFASEVFNRAEKKIQDFLLRTSFLPKLSAAMAQRLTGVDDAAEILARLNRNNYFTEKHFHPDPVYQYNALFREFLLARAKKTLSPEELIQIQRDAADLLEETGDLEDAVQLLSRSRDWNKLVRLILINAQTMNAQGRIKTFEEWLTLLPGEVLEKTPWLLYWQGVCRLVYQPVESRAFFEKAFILFKSGGDAAGQFLACSSIMNSYRFEWNILAPFDRWIAEAENLMKEYQKFPSPAIEMHFTYGMFISMMYRQPQHSQFSSWEEALLALMRSCSDNNLRVTMGNALFLHYIWAGYFFKGRNIIRELEPAVNLSEVTPTTRIIWYLQLAAVRWATGEFDTCLNAIREGLNIAETEGIYLFNSRLFAQGIYHSLITGDLQASADFLNKMASATDMTKCMDAAFYHYFVGWDALSRGEFASAIKIAERTLKLAEEAGMPFSVGLSHLLLANGLYEAGNKVEAVFHLVKGRRIGINTKSMLIEHTYWLMISHFRLNLGGEKHKKGIRTLQKAMMVSKTHAIAGFVGMGRPAVMQLYLRALEENIEPEHVQKLAALYRLFSEKAPGYMESWPWPIKIYTLGRFELVREGQSIRFAGKLPKRPLLLLKALVAHKGRIREEKLCDLFWPEAEGDAAHKALGVTVIRLRRIIGIKDSIEYQGGVVSLKAGTFWVDSWAFESLLKESDTRPSLLEEAIKLYKGPFLAGEPESWMMPFRERLSKSYNEAKNQLAVLP